MYAAKNSSQQSKEANVHTYLTHLYLNGHGWVLVLGAHQLMLDNHGCFGDALGMLWIMCTSEAGRVRSDTGLRKQWG
eukprot:1161269-Pelagomonas_calceolata.AAC.4